MKLVFINMHLALINQMEIFKIFKYILNYQLLSKKKKLTSAPEKDKYKQTKTKIHFLFALKVMTEISELQKKNQN